MCLEKALASTSTLSMHQRRTNGEHRISRQIELSLAEKKSITCKVKLGLSFLKRQTRPIRDPKHGRVFAYILQPLDPAYLKILRIWKPERYFHHNTH